MREYLKNKYFMEDNASISIEYIRLEMLEPMEVLKPKIRQVTGWKSARPNIKFAEFCAIIILLLELEYR